MTMAVKGRIDWSMARDKDGHREYTIQWLCGSNDQNDGPGWAFLSSGLPLVGAYWNFGNELDLWAFCLPMQTAKPLHTTEPGHWWIVEQIFSTKPLSRCQDTSIENPLAEPDRLGGSFVKYMKEAVRDRHGNALKSSSHEMFRGPLVEFDHNRPTVVVEKNLASLPLSTFSPMIDTVNNHSLWGLTERMVKLSNATWSRRLYGTCTYFYVVTYEFDIDFNTFDRRIIDEGTKVLSKGGDPNDPRHFVQYKDVNGENTRVLLNGAGVALSDGASPYEFELEYYPESNFFALGIPASL